jgi:demethoxyubiquinone hydroxylase (CLK1/Coq7/Cat5 family)
MNINFEAKTDRELLVLVAQNCNETTNHLARINDKLLKHEKRITILEAVPTNWRAKLRENWQTFSLLVSVIALIVIVVVEKVATNLP